MKRAKSFVIAAILSLLAVFCLIGCADKPQTPEDKNPPANEPVYYNVVINGETQQVKEGDKIAKPATDPTKSTSDADYDADMVYTFDGWYISGTNTAWNFDSDTVTKDITLVAKFSSQFNSTLIAPVMEAINALPSTAAVTLTDEDDITAAKEAYDALSASRKSHVSAELVTKLNALVEELDRLDEINESSRTFAGSSETLRVPTVNLAATSNATGYTVEYTVKSGSGTIEDNVLTVTGNATVVVTATYKYNTVSDATVQFTNVEHTEEATFTFEQYTVTGTVTLDDRFTDETFTENTQIVIGGQSFDVNSDGTYTAKMWGTEDAAVKVSAVNEAYLDGVASVTPNGNATDVDLEFKYFGITLSGVSATSENAVIDYETGKFTDVRTGALDHGFVVNKTISADTDFKYSFTFYKCESNKAGACITNGEHTYALLYDYDTQENANRIFGGEVWFNTTANVYRTFGTQSQLAFDAIADDDTAMDFTLYRVNGEYFLAVTQYEVTRYIVPTKDWAKAVSESFGGDIQVGVICKDAKSEFTVGNVDLTLDYTDDNFDSNIRLTAYAGSKAADAYTISTEATQFTYIVKTGGTYRGGSYPTFTVKVTDEEENVSAFQISRFNYRWALINNTGLPDYVQTKQMMIEGAAGGFNGKDVTGPMPWTLDADGSEKLDEKGNKIAFEPSFAVSHDHLVPLSGYDEDKNNIHKPAKFPEEVILVRNGAYLGIYELNDIYGGRYVNAGYVYLEGMETGALEIGGAVCDKYNGFAANVRGASFTESIDTAKLFEATTVAGRGSMITYDNDFEAEFAMEAADGKFMCVNIVLMPYYTGVTSPNGKNLHIQFARYTARWTVLEETGSGSTYTQENNLFTQGDKGGFATGAANMKTVNATQQGDLCNGLPRVQDVTLTIKVVRHGNVFTVYEKGGTNTSYFVVATMTLDESYDGLPLGVGIKQGNAAANLLKAPATLSYTKLETVTD